MTEQTVASLAQFVGGRVVGDGSVRVTGVCDLRNARPDWIGFVRDASYRDAARTTTAGALITGEELQTRAAQIVVADVGLAFARVAALFHPPPRATEHRVDPSAAVDPGAELESPVTVGPRAVVGRARIGAGSFVMAGSVVADGCRIGRDCVLYPNVTLYPGVRLGDRVLIHSGTVIGSDGFGYVRQGPRWLKVPQLGTVVIDDDVEIGANCTVDRGALGETRIGPGCKIDNLCHIAHNVVIGRDTVMAAACLLAGSTTLGERVSMAGHVVTAGQLRVVDDARIGGNSVLLRDVLEPGDYMGYPLMDKQRFFRHLAALRELVELEKTVEEMEERAPAPDEG
jgi:UDP-3-O-[3-hydroxymyristoyl] glucosamine N-acyltransferase